MKHTLHTLHTLNFDNSYLNQLPQSLYSHAAPNALTNPYLISFNASAAHLLDLNPGTTEPQALTEFFSGAQILPGSEPVAMKYAGHQFGVYNPALGDGRGLLLGEVVNKAGQRWDLHLKGAGKTPYSRFGDGRALVRSGIREYLAGEAMYGLGIPTTRGLCLLGSEDIAMRETPEPCATLLRLSQCHIRFGHFEYLFYENRYDELQQLADYCIERFYPHVADAEQVYVALFAAVVKRTARLLALWQSYGFVHGVLNTDNMSILAETFDYGPYTFMDGYEPALVSNQSDYQGRYAFKRQPSIVLWNLACLGHALSPLAERSELEGVLETYQDQFAAYETDIWRQRLGLEAKQSQDAALARHLRILMAEQGGDMTRFMRALSRFDGTDTATKNIAAVLNNPQVLRPWLKEYGQRLALECRPDSARHAAMLAVNPKYILRNYMAEVAIEAAHQGNFEPVNQLLDLLRNPFSEQSEFERYAGPVPKREAETCLSCSS